MSRERLRTAGRPAAAELAGLRDGVQIVDVRGPGEIAGSGLVPGAVPVPLPVLVSRLEELDPAAPTAVYCAGGYRSSIVASLLRACGFDRVDDLLGGFGARADGSCPVLQPAGA